MAIKDKLIEDNIGATSQSTSPAYLNPPGNIFTNAPIYTDQLAAIADWFKENWKDTSRAPRVAYLTADSTLGRNIDIPEMKAYLEGIGYEFAGAQYVPMVPTAPPTTQLAWLKDNKVDLALGIMINPGAQPTIKEATRLGMGPDLDYKITFGFAYPAHLQVFVPAMGETGNGVVVAGDFCALDADVEGIAFANELQETYRPDKKVSHVMYLCGIVEAMTQVEALRLASAAGDPATLTSVDVLEKGFQQIKDFSTGDIVITNLTYGPGDPEGVDAVRLQQAQDREDRRARIVSAARHHPEVAASSSVGAPSRGPQRFTVAAARPYKGCSPGVRAGRLQPQAGPGHRPTRAAALFSDVLGV